jgi:hypothetical protein
LRSQEPHESGQKTIRFVACPEPQPSLKELLDVLSTSIGLAVSHSGRPRPSTHANRTRPKLTPGDTFDVTAQDLCVPGYAKKVRNVPEEMRRQVYREYGITSRGRGDYEIDHLISLELGGSNSIKNLWPESYRTSPWNARVKDRLEDKLHQLVCGGQLDLKTGQQAIASNWIEAYQKYVSPNPPGTEPASRRASGLAATSGKVWVNTRSREVLEARIAVLRRNEAG